MHGDGFVAESGNVNSFKKTAIDDVPHRERTIGRIPASIVRAGECMAISARMLATQKKVTHQSFSKAHNGAPRKNATTKGKRRFQNRWRGLAPRLLDNQASISDVSH